MLTDGRALKSKASRVFDCWEPGRLEAAFGRALLPVEQFEFEQLQQVGEVVDVVGGSLSGHLLALRADRRQAKRFQVVLEQDHGLGLEGLHW